MKLTLSVQEFRELISRGVIVPLEPGLETWKTSLDDDPRVGLSEGVAKLSREADALQQEIDVLEARAAAAKPLVEAQDVINTARDLWIQLDAHFRYCCEEWGLASGADTSDRAEQRAVAWSELQRCIRALGDHLGEEGGTEGGEDLDPPC